MSAMQSATSQGLGRVKTGSSLLSTEHEVGLLQQLHEHWRISVQRVDVIWVRVIDPSHARALMLKLGETRRLYRQGQRAPMLVAQGSYYNLYELDHIGGSWLVSQVLGLDDATGSHLASAPPRGITPANVGRPSPTPSSRGLKRPTVAPTAASPTARPTVTPSAGEKAPTVIPTATEAATAPRATTAEAVAVVRRFYGLLAAHNYSAAYKLYSAHLQAQIPDQRAWASLYYQEVAISVLTARVKSQSGQLATVALTIDTTWSVNPTRRRFVGEWQLVHGPAGWRLDSVSLHLVAT
jgi:hypothetical protein